VHEHKYHKEFALNNVALKLKSNYEKILKYIFQQKAKTTPSQTSKNGGKRQKNNK
jgi:hypothetical protein